MCIYTRVLPARSSNSTACHKTTLKTKMIHANVNIYFPALTYFHHIHFRAWYFCPSDTLSRSRSLPVTRRKGRRRAIILYPCEPGGPHSSAGAMRQTDNYRLRHWSPDCGMPTLTNISAESTTLNGKLDVDSLKKKCEFYCESVQKCLST